MNKKRKILRIAIAVFMVFALFLTTSQTLAYWAEPTVVTETAESTGVVSVGDWEQAFPYDPNFNDYVAGDLVTYNGQTYEARNDYANSLTPGVGWFWWLGWRQI